MLTLLVATVLAGPRPLPPLSQPACAVDGQTLSSTVTAWIPGTRSPLGKVFTDQHTTVSVQLGGDPARPTLRAHVQDKNMAVDVDFVPDDAPVALRGELSSGAVTVGAGARVKVLALAGDQVQVEPYVAGGSRTLDPVRPVALTVGCADLGLARRLSSEEYEIAREKMGLDDREVVYLKAGARLFDAPQGALLGTLAADAARHAWLVERKGAWAKVLVGEAGGWFWTGWTRELAAPPAPAKSAGLGMIGSLGLGGGEPFTPIVYHACASAQPLYGVDGAELQSIGTLSAQVPFVVIGEGPDGAAIVQPSRGFLSAATEALLAMDGSARDCPVVNTP